MPSPLKTVRSDEPDENRGEDHLNIAVDSSDSLSSKSYAADSPTSRLLAELFPTHKNNASRATSHLSMHSSPRLTIDELLDNFPPSPSPQQLAAPPRPVLASSHADQYINTDRASTPSRSVSCNAIVSAARSLQNLLIARSVNSNYEYSLRASGKRSHASSSSSSSDWPRGYEKRQATHKSYLNGTIDGTLLQMNSPAVPRSPAIPLITQGPSPMPTQPTQNDQAANTDNTVPITRQLRGRALHEVIDKASLPLRSSIRLSQYQQPVFEAIQARLQAEASKIDRAAAAAAKR
jgi:hypothetical protein